MDDTLTKVMKEVTSLLCEVNSSLKGLLVEHKGEQRRFIDARDFSLNEIKRLAVAVERLTARLDKLK